MGFLDKVRKGGFFGGNEEIDDDYYDDEEEYEEDEEEDEFEEEEYVKPEHTEQPIQRTTPAAKRTAYVAPKPENSAASDTRVLNIHATAQLQVVISKPEVMEDAYDIADHLLKKHTVVLNLETTNKEIGKRIVDFLSGVVYANNGHFSRVANATFVITPYDVGIIGQDVIGELENSGVFF